MLEQTSLKLLGSSRQFPFLINAAVHIERHFGVKRKVYVPITIVSCLWNPLYVQKPFPLADSTVATTVKGYLKQQQQRIPEKSKYRSVKKVLYWAVNVMKVLKSKINGKALHSMGCESRKFFPSYTIYSYPRDMKKSLPNKSILCNTYYEAREINAQKLLLAQLIEVWE